MNLLNTPCPGFDTYLEFFGEGHSEDGDVKCSGTIGDGEDDLAPCCAPAVEAHHKADFVDKLAANLEHVSTAQLLNIVHLLAGHRHHSLVVCRTVRVACFDREKKNGNL